LYACRKILQFSRFTNITIAIINLTPNPKNTANITKKIKLDGKRMQHLSNQALQHIHMNPSSYIKA